MVTLDLLLMYSVMDPGRPQEKSRIIINRGNTSFRCFHAVDSFKFKNRLKEWKNKGQYNFRSRDLDK